MLPRAGLAEQPVDKGVGAKIGPNALIQTVCALRETISEQDIVAILRQAKQEYLLNETVTGMVDEGAFAELVAALVAQLGLAQARQVLWRSGELTAGYLLQHRIPQPFQWLLRPLPNRLALKLLLWAISKHAWTFAGSGSFQYEVSQQARLTVTSPIRPAEAVCGFYGGTFAHLIRVLIDTQAQVETKVSASDGWARCIYLIQYRAF
ncbi:MAG: bacteriochlorophyll 4-vinyl reductase [Anaerolineae bacterium]|nr:bacteriochlorophyll 4-vinyl reductase [Anaerolineae bacterium]